MADNSAVTSNSSSAIGDIGTTAACRPGNHDVPPDMPKMRISFRAMARIPGNQESLHSQEMVQLLQ